MQEGCNAVMLLASSRPMRNASALGEHEGGEIIRGMEGEGNMREGGGNKRDGGDGGGYNMRRGY